MSDHMIIPTKGASKTALHKALAPSPTARLGPTKAQENLFFHNYTVPASDLASPSGSASPSHSKEKRPGKGDKQQLFKRISQFANEVSTCVAGPSRRHPVRFEKWSTASRRLVVHHIIIIIHP